MLGEKDAPNPVPFHPNAQKSFFITHLLIPLVVLAVAAIIIGLIFLPLIIPLVILFAAAMVFAWWYSGEFFRKFAFGLRADYLFSRKGVFKASYTTIPYERIQDIHVTQSLLESLFGTWTVSLYTATATGRGSEAIHGLGKDGAETLKSSLFAKIKKVREVVD